MDSRMLERFRRSRKTKGHAESRLDASRFGELGGARCFTENRIFLFGFPPGFLSSGELQHPHITTHGRIPARRHIGGRLKIIL